MLAADYIIDIGPGAGAHGGEVVAAGNAGGGDGATRNRSPAQYLSGRQVHPVPEERRKPNGKWLEVRGAKENNLKNIDVQDSAGRVRLRHRRVRLGQKHAGQRNAATRRWPAS